MPSKRDRQIEQVLKQIEQTVKDAEIRAINIIAEQVRRQSIELIADNMGVDRSLLSDHLVKPGAGIVRMIPAIRRRPTASIKVRGKRVPLIDMGGRWSRVDPGASYVGFKGRRKVVPGSFIATMPTGHRGIYKRRGKKRFPIRELFGTSAPVVFQQDFIQRPIRQYIRDRLPDELRKQLRKHA